MSDLCNHPPHYLAGRYESIKIIEAYELGFSLGNALKYLLRCGRKGSKEDSIQDLKKARWYINREIRKRRKELTNV